VQDQGKVESDQGDVVLGVLKLLEKVQTQDTPPLAAKFIRARAWDQAQTHLSTEDLRKAFARKMSLRMLLDIHQLKKTIRNGIEQGVWVYYDAAEEMGYNADSPQPTIQISEETFLYTPEEYARLGWPIKGVTPITPPPPVGRCPICGNPQDKCTCGTTPPDDRVIHGEGAPGQAFQRVADLCVDKGIAWLGRLTVSIQGNDQQGAGEVRALGLAIPQMGKGNFRVEQSLAVEFEGDEQIRVEFKGSWDRYKRLKQVTDAFAQEGRKLNARTTLRADFPAGLDVRGDQFRTIHEVFDQLGFGYITVEARPFDEDQSA